MYVCVPVFEGVPRLITVPKGRISALIFRLTGSHTLRHQVFKSMQIYTVLRDCQHRSSGYHNQVI